jgi:carboxyl-terminal processing protease
MPTFSKKILEIGLAVIAVILLLGSGFWLGWSAGRNVPKNIVVSGLTDAQTPSSTAADFGVFWQAWAAINDNYLRNPSTTSEDKVYGAITGLVNSLNDPYSEFFTPQTNQQFQENITGDFGGIGAQLGVDANGHIVIIAPLKGTPAEKAGLKAKDWVVAIDATSTDGISVDDAVSLIRGPEGTTVTLSIVRSGWDKPKDFKIVRANIQVPNVDLEMKGDIAHLSLHEFTQDADMLFYQKLVEILSNNAKGIVLDLRDDPGGYLEVATDLAGYFLKPGTLVVKEVGRTVPEEDFKAQGDGALADFPMVILINNGSASASEILAGALHDDRGIRLVGETSFGKGTVQELEPLSDGSAVKLTIAHWVLPSGKILDHDGLTPDYEVKISDSDIAAGRDPQLDKAIAVLQAQIGK